MILTEGDRQFRMRRAALLPLLATLAAVVGPVAAAPAAAAPSDDASPAGELVVFAGTGERGDSGDGGPATAARLNRPRGVAVAPDGTVYISDQGNHKVRAVAPDGTIRTVVGTGKAPPTLAVRDGVPGTRFDLSGPDDLAVGPDGSVYLADFGRWRIFRLAPDGRVRTIAGTGERGYSGDGGAATDAQIGQTTGLAVGPDGTVYFGDQDSHRVRSVTPDGTISTVAGNGSLYFPAAGGPATGIAVPGPHSLSRDSAGDLWWVAGDSVLQRCHAGRVVTITRPGVPSRQRWDVTDVASWPPPEPPLRAELVAVDGATGYVLSGTEGLLRLGAGGRLELVAGYDDRQVFARMAAAGGVVYLVDAGDRVFFVRPAPPAAPPSASGSSTPWWPFAAVAAGVVLLTVTVLWVRRRRRPNV
jgi:sugar lactone lactonase YvrE